MLRLSGCLEVAGVASSLAAWAQNSILKGAGGGIRGYRPHPPGTVLPGVPQALEGLV